MSEAHDDPDGDAENFLANLDAHIADTEKTLATYPCPRCGRPISNYIGACPSCVMEQSDKRSEIHEELVPSEQIQAWIGRAYRAPEDKTQIDAKRFTRWNMEVAYLAGFQEAWSRFQKEKG